MQIIATVLSFFMVLALVLVTSTTEVHPSEISLGMSSSLDINCSFSSVDHPEMAAFVSLILSRANSSGQEFQVLAQITEFSPDSVSLLTQEKVSATGVHSQTGVSFIDLTWEFPTATQAGFYQCAAHGIDTLGQLLEMVNVSTVTANLNDIDLFEKLQQMEIRQTAMENTIISLEKRIQALEHNNSLMCACNLIDDHNVTLQPLEVLNYLGAYQNHDYYFSKDGYGNINNSMDVCESYGGYLVEIDDENEFNALTGFLNNTSGFIIAIIAGTDEASDGTWVFQSNNQTLPFTNWLYDGASTGTSDNCLGIDRRSSWQMDDWWCNYDSPLYYVRFTCEIPQT